MAPRSKCFYALQDNAPLVAGLLTIAAIFSLGLVSAVYVIVSLARVLMGR